MQSLRLPHTYRPPLLPAPPPAHCQGSRGAAATLYPGSLLPFHGGVHVPLHCPRILVHSTHVPAGAVPARVHVRRWRVPGLAQSHLRACSHIPCVSTGDAQAASLHKQGQPTRMHACCIMGISLHALVTVSHARGDALPPPALLWWGCCCYIPEEGSQSVPTVCSPGSPFSALAAHFLPPPSSPLTSLLSLLTNECPSHLLRQGQSPTSLCTCLSALHGSRAGCDRQVEQSGKRARLPLPSLLSASRSCPSLVKSRVNLWRPSLLHSISVL